MNVLITNRQEEMLAGLDVEIIKTLRGEYAIDEIVSQFSNFFFARMILDITAIRDSKNIVNYQKLSIGLPVDKVVLLLPNTPDYSNPSFLSKLISMGFYNFTTDLEGVKYLLNSPNTYKDVAYLHQIEAPQTAVRQENTVTDSIPVVVNTMASNGPMILGVKNLTDGAGSTTLVYLLKKDLEANNLSTVAIEVNKRDFMYFNDSTLKSVSKIDAPAEIMRSKGVNVILLDLNDGDESWCDDIIYLIEPSIIKLNKLMKRDNKIFDRMKGKKIVLNKTLLSEKDVNAFEYETGIKVFMTLNPVDDRKNPPFFGDLLRKMGLI